MTATGFEFLLLGLLLGAGLGFLAGRNRAALSALAQARLDGAQSNAARDLTERQRAIEELVDPLQDALNRVQQQLHTAERDRLAATAALDEHLTAMRTSADGLRTETGQLVTALRAPQVRGRWVNCNWSGRSRRPAWSSMWITSPNRPSQGWTGRSDLTWWCGWSAASTS